MRRKLFSSTKSEVARRKLFSAPSVPTRRKLFSDEVEAKLPPVAEEDKKIIKCMDCGQTYEYTGSDTHLICTKCGSDRFEFITNISNPDDIEPGDLNPIDKAFSEKRRKLFNDVSEVEANAMNMPPLDTPTNSLTNESEERPEYTHICPDCNNVFMATEYYVDKAICPKCGGTRCRKWNEDTQYENLNSCEDAEDSMFSDIESDGLDELLARHKGKAIDADELAAEMHAMGIYEEVGGIEGLVENGYADFSDDAKQVQFSNIADTQRKMFSKLVISVTREFDIDPVIDRESVIDSLAERFPGKPIMILKRAQSTVAPEVTTFSDKSYLKDSGIESDIKLVYGGQSMAIKDFMNLLSEEYPDAPEDIIDLLESSKAIKVNGGKVLISK